MPASAPASIAAARAAKARLSRELADAPGIVAIGLTRLADGGWAVKVDVADAAAPGVPGEVDGVAVVVERVGRIVRQSASSDSRRRSESGSR